MMRKLNLGKTIIVTGLISMMAMGTIYAAEEKAASSLDGDEVTYDMKTGEMEAKGHVLLTHGDSRATGDVATFNTKTKASTIRGNVLAISGDMRLTADVCTSDGNEHMVAEGNVHATKADKTYSGPRVDYYQSDSYILMDQGGEITSTSGDVFRADRMEGWSDKNIAKGVGNAYVKSPSQDLEAGGDVVDYYGKVKGSDEPGKAILTGNAWAYQDNNTLKSEKLTIILSDEGEAQVGE